MAQEEYKFKSVSEYGQYAPPDAFEEDSNYAYYGSENEWNRRMFSEKAASMQYKRSGQRLLLFVLDGKIDSAITNCKNRLKKYPNDLEALFILTIAYCQLENEQAALETAKKALESGIPLERFIAGPRELLKTLLSTKEFSELLKKDNIRIVHGPMLGDVTENGIGIWLRTSSESEVELNVFEENNLKRDRQKYLQSSTKSDDYVLKFNIDNLLPGTTYKYDLIVDGKLEITGKSFSTLKEKEHLNNIRIIFGGGAGYTPAHTNTWNEISKRNPDALLLLGDNVYIDLPEMPGSFHDYTYYRRQSEASYRKLVSEVPVYSIWDDHDAGTDDVWMGPYVDKPNWKLPMLEHFERQWINPAYGEEGNPGCYYNFSIGDINIFMLDCRFYRTNPFKDEKTMLGPKQKEWLKKQLLKSNGKFKLIVSSVPWSPDAKPGSNDTWDGFSQEREEIFSFLEENKIEGVVLVAADRHRSDAWKIERENGYDLYEFQSSKLTNIHTHEIMENSLIGYNVKCSFGELEFDLVAVDPELKYSIVNIDGELIDSIKVNYSELRFD
jgi:alkaline phosphatase D